jgi:tetratricopeptide repeat protein 21B
MIESDEPEKPLFFCPSQCSEGQAVNYLIVLRFPFQFRTGKRQTLAVGFKFYSELNVSQIITIAKVYLKHTKSYDQLDTSWNKNDGTSGSTVASQAEKYLQPILASCPGLAEAYFLMAKIKLYANDRQSALCLIDKCIQRNGSFGDALLLKAHICVLEQKTQMAVQALESALSHDFQIRDQPLYTLVRARTLALSRKYDEAIDLLNDRQHSTGSRRKNALTVAERFTFDLLTLDLFINAGKQVRLSLSLSLTDRNVCFRLSLSLSPFTPVTCNPFELRQNEANELIDDLQRKYHSDSQAKRQLLLAKAHLLESVGQISQAINVLSDVRIERNVTEDADEMFEFYVKSRRKLAHLHLTYLKDQKQYAKCFHDILQQNSSIESHLMLGDAYMIILEVRQAN